MGASPDGFTQCDCCGKGVLEVKCPYTHRHKSLRSAAEDANFCLEKTNDGFSLKRSHQYHYQVQVQIAVCDVEYGDFCVCLFSDSDADGLHIERIMRDEAFWSKCLPKVSDFFNTSVLPELVGKLSTSSSARLSDPACPPPLCIIRHFASCAIFVSFIKSRFCIWLYCKCFAPRKFVAFFPCFNSLCTKSSAFNFYVTHTPYAHCCRFALLSSCCLLPSTSCATSSS